MIRTPLPFSSPLLALLVVSAAIGAAPAFAQSWPNKPVRLVVPATTGGTIDPLGRVAADQLSKAFGQQFVVENRPGAQGNTGIASVAKAEPDGYTIGIAASSMIAINPHLYKSVGYDPFKDIAPIVLIGDVQNVLAVHPSLPVTTLKEFIDYAKSHPNQLNFGSSGNGSSMHLSGELFKKLTGAQMQHVPYSNVGEATRDLIAGRTQLMFQLMTGIQGQIKAGQARGIVVLSDRRSANLPDLPTTKELGMPDLQSSVWFGLYGPAGMPRAVVDRIAGEMRTQLKDPAFRQRVVGLGADPMDGGPAEFAKLHAEEYKKWGEIVRISGAKID